MAVKDYVALEKERPGLCFYLANIMRGGRSGCGIGGVDKAVENAIARTLYRAGEPLPKHGEPHAVARVRGNVTITNLLPAPLMGRLRKAYAASGSDAVPA